MGIPTGGAIDQFSAQAANLLVGNQPDAALLETTYTSPRFIARKDVGIAVTGGTTTVSVNGSSVPQWSTIYLSAGDEVSFSPASHAPRIYIAFGGGIDVPVVFHSRSTYLAGALGGYKGRKIQAGDILPLGESSSPRQVREVPEEFRLQARKSDHIRVVPGLHVERLAQQSYDDFFGTEWKLTPLGDRSGMRYAGPKIIWDLEQNVFGAGSDPSNIADAGYPMGAIEVPGGNEPILMHRDGPTMGGYAMLGVTARADMDIVGQQMPGESTYFVPISRVDALQAWERYKDSLIALNKAVTSS
jgi:biotin-dependent carboxylase-like uncharacterized protein